MSEKSELQPFPYREQSDFQFQLIGSWRGGILELTAGDQLIGVLELSAALFSVFALLAKASLGASYWEKSFVQTDELADALERRAGIGGRDPDLMHRTVYRLRQSLDEAEVSLKLPRAKRADPLGSRLIESVPRFGYRLSISPDRLRLRLTDGDTDDKRG